MTTALPLPIARLHLTARVEAPLHLPPYAGSMLRGAFGHALLALAPLPHLGNQPCALQQTCAYCQVFATPALPAHSLQKFSHVPTPYVIEPPDENTQILAAGSEFAFGLVLIGKAWQHVPAIVPAWERALRHGLGKEHIRCTLLTVHLDDPAGREPHLLWRPGQPALQTPTPPPLPPAPALQQQVALHLTSPLRLQRDSKPVRADRLDARTLLVTLARRWQLLQDVHLGPQAPQQDFAALARAAEGIQLDARGLRWMDWGRFSQHQQREMKLGGLVGTLRLHGDLAPFAELLHLGQWMHAGKNTSFGLGGYRLQTQVARHASGATAHERPPLQPSRNATRRPTEPLHPAADRATATLIAPDTSLHPRPS